MMPNITRGDRVAGVMVYLAGEGRHNEHTNPHVVAGHDVIVDAVGGRELSTDDALDIANELDLPRRVFGTRVTVPVKEWSEEQQRQVKVGDRDAHVWHCSLSLRAEEGTLSDEQWNRIATDFVEGMGFGPTGDDGAGCRWVAVRHGLSSAGNDHVHIVVNLVREDGTKASVHNDQPRAQRLANELEHRHGLQVLESREVGRGALAGAKPAELGRAEREGAALPARDELRRRVRAAAGKRRASASSWTRCATCACWSGPGTPRAGASASSGTPSPSRRPSRTASARRRCGTARAASTSRWRSVSCAPAGAPTSPATHP